MSDKPWNKLNEVDRWIRSLSPNKGMGDGPQIRITLHRGFELYNTRPYHNYENWSDGYKVEAFDDNGEVMAWVSREDLDDALKDMDTLLKSKGIIK